MSARKSSRRKFLQGRSAIDAWEDFTDARAPEPDAKDGYPLAGAGSAASSASDDQTPQTRPAPKPYLIQIGRRAMACQFEIYLYAGRHAWGEEAAVATLDLIDQLEDQLTVYREHSEVSRLNRRAPHEAVPVEAGLFGLLQRALQLHRDTEGAFDITAGPLVKAWGFFRRAGRFPRPEEMQDALARVGSQHIVLSESNQTVRFLRPDVEINLGAIGKGYALERGAENLLSEGVSDFLFHGGQSSVLARGAHDDTDADRPGWIVGLRHPLRPERRLAEIRLFNEALATSGSGTQFFHHQGRRYGHILDPRTGLPAEGVLSSTVIAPSAADADALATAFYVWGAEKALAHCQRHPEIATILATPGKRAGAIELQTANLSEDRWKLV